MKFVKIFWKNKVKDADIPKISISGEIVSEILAHLCSDDSLKILLNWLGFKRLELERTALNVHSFAAEKKL